MPAIKIFEPSTAAHFEAARQLFKEYIEFLYGLPNMHVHIDKQDFREELAELEKGKYTPPGGAILLALQEQEFLGLVALRKLTDEICEMKRLYVRPAGRGAAVGFQLALQIIEEAKKIGYQKMRLDTHAAMVKAHQLYYSLGFYTIPRYNDNIVPGALFMELDFKKYRRAL
jgi:putative acetyltransferase